MWYIIYLQLLTFNELFTNLEVKNMMGVRDVDLGTACFFPRGAVIVPCPAQILEQFRIAHAALKDKGH